MWWSSKGDESFTKSKSLGLIARWYEAIDGHETFILADIGKRFKLCDQKTYRLKLPEHIQLPATLPDGTFIVISASEDKGIRICFERTPSHEKREEIWLQFAECAERWKATLKKVKAPKDNYTCNKQFKFMVESTAIEEKKGEKLQGIGIAFRN